MKAICYNFPTDETIIHNHVVELNRLSSNRRFRCEDCGLEWIENLSSPQIIEESDIKFLNNTKNCKLIKSNKLWQRKSLK